MFLKVNWNLNFSGTYFWELELILLELELILLELELILLELLT